MDTKLKGYKILVTGGAGFIGSHLTERLLKMGSEVTVLDDFFVGRNENLRAVLKSPRINMINGDMHTHVWKGEIESNESK